MLWDLLEDNVICFFGAFNISNKGLNGITIKNVCKEDCDVTAKHSCEAMS